MSAVRGKFLIAYANKAKPSHSTIISIDNWPMRLRSTNIQVKCPKAQCFVGPSKVIGVPTTPTISNNVWGCQYSCGNLSSRIQHCAWVCFYLFVLKYGIQHDKRRRPGLNSTPLLPKHFVNPHNRQNKFIRILTKEHYASLAQRLPKLG